MTKPNVETIEKTLKLRERVKKKKPKFVRGESWRYIRLKENWRKPNGLDNKMRRRVKGWPPSVNVGYRGPKVARGLHPSGYEEVLVHNAEDLEKIDPKTQAIRIAHTVGKRKRTRILVEAKKKKITILNLKEVKEVAEEKKPEESEEAEVTETEKPKRKRRKTEKSESEAEEH